MLFSNSFISLDRQRDLLMYINVAVISVMAHNLNVVVHILIVQQVSVVICSAWENKSYDVSSPPNANGIFRHIKMLAKLVLASLLNDYGPLSLDRSECCTTIFKMRHTINPALKNV